MKNILTRGLLCLLLMSLPLGGCGNTAANESSSESTEPATEAITEAATEAAPIPGVDASNYPRVRGSTATLPLMARIYSEVCGVSVEDAETMVTASGGTGEVWRNMQWDGADLLLAYEAPESIEALMREESVWDALEITPIGRDGLVFLVNTANPVDSLTQSQLVEIYSGTITDWQEVGGDPGPIKAFQRNEESGSQALFLDLLMKDTAPMTPPTALVAAAMAGLIDGVAEYDGSGGALGYSVFYYASQMYANPGIKLLAVDGVAATNESIASGEYPLANDFYVVIRKDAAADSPARLLRDWLLSDAGQAVMAEEGYVMVG